MQLQWQPLPCCLPMTQATSAAAESAEWGDGIDPALENPPINPIVGPGRTAAQVQHEVRAYQARRRAAARGTNNPAIFQAEYLFVQLPGRSVELHRVANSMYIYNAEAEELSFSTSEYMHTPQEGVPGFWGYFELRPNPSFDEKDPRKGPRNIRHHNVGRDCIKMYDVETFPVCVEVDGVERAKTVVRVSAAALRELASICPELPRIPDQIPDTHTEAATTGVP
eukprot:6193823-Pleurochrysis_carterae.AAC.1